MIYDNFPWLKNRELRIIEIISETLILFFITNNNKFDNQFFIYSIPIIFFWICINYIFGRYVSIDNFKKTSLLNNLIYCSVSIIFIFLFLFSISQFNISKSEFFNNKNLINFLIEFAFIVHLLSSYLIFINFLQVSFF